MSKRRGVEQFLNDVKPFFYGKPLTYVDVGAYKAMSRSLLI